MTDAITLRDATPDDAAAITAIYAHHVRTGTGSFELDPPDVAEIARRMQDLHARGLPWIVALRGAQVAGYAYAAPFRLRPAYRFTLEDSVYVQEGEGGRGIGSLLLAELLARCEAGGCRQMVALIGDSANAASIALHAGHGFRHAGLLAASGWKFGRWVDTVLMQRELGPGATEHVKDQ